RWMDGRNQQLYVDTVSYLPHQLLSLLDRTTMAASIEGRVPFLDRGVVAAAFRIHGRHKYRGRYGNKWLLRQLAAAHLPPGTVQRRKLGFPNSVAKWLAPDRLLAIRDRLWARGSFIAAAFPGAWLSQLLASADALQHNALTVHSLLVLEAWQRRFVAPARFEVRQELAYTVHPL
ncbi:MAG TPA: asparagine synthase-related protein, partial [Planctomycetota bacterium]|nr:asparagine synthase-related protein [Planctomycetota bacterium]